MSSAEPPRELRTERTFRWAGGLGAALIRLWGATLRVDYLGREHLAEVERRGGGCLWAFWHGRLLTLAYAFRNQGVVVLVSRHKDGEFISQIICREFVGRRSARPTGDGTRRQGGTSPGRYTRWSPWTARGAAKRDSPHCTAKPIADSAARRRGGSQNRAFLLGPIPDSASLESGRRRHRGADLDSARVGREGG